MHTNVAAPSNASQKKINEASNALKAAYGLLDLNGFLDSEYLSFISASSPYRADQALYRHFTEKYPTYQVLLAKLRTGGIDSPFFQYLRDGKELSALCHLLLISNGAPRYWGRYNTSDPYPLREELREAFTKAVVTTQNERDRRNAVAMAVRVWKRTPEEAGISDHCLKYRAMFRVRVATHKDKPDGTIRKFMSGDAYGDDLTRWTFYLFSFPLTSSPARLSRVPHA